MELANSGFEYFAGGEFQKVNGDVSHPNNNHEVCMYRPVTTLITTQAGAAALKAGAGKTLIIAENLADGKAAELRHGCRSGRVAADRLCPQGH